MTLLSSRRMKQTAIIDGKREWLFPICLEQAQTSSIYNLILQGLEEATSSEPNYIYEYGWVIFEVEPIVIEVHRDRFSLVSEHLPRRDYNLSKWTEIFDLIREYWIEVKNFSTPPP